MVLRLIVIITFISFCITELIFYANVIKTQKLEIRVNKLEEIKGE